MNSIVDVMRFILETKSNDLDLVGQDGEVDATVLHCLGFQPRAQEDAPGRVYRNLNARISRAAEEENLGCTAEELVRHLESKFEDDMSWINYGRWHIDHIRPVSSFDLADSEQKKKARHYTNLQPLWAEDNHRKGAKYDC